MNGWWGVGLAAAALAAFLAGDAVGVRRGLRVPGTLRESAEKLIRQAAALGFSAATPRAGALRPDEAAVDIERLRLWWDEEWRRSEEERRRLSAVLSGLTEGILLVDRYARVLLSNDVAAALWPRLRPLVRGPLQLELFGDPELDVALSEALGRAEARQVDIERPGPPRRFFRVRVLPVGGGAPAASKAVPAGEAAGALIVVQDTTEHHAVEQVRRDFVANVSHELQTPLTSVRGYAETLREGGLSPDERRRFTGRILQEAERMAALVRDLLALAQLEAPRWAATEPVPLERIAREVAASLSRFAAERSVSLRVEADLAVVSGRADELRRAVDNLVRNALAYTAAGGRVVVRVQRRGDQATVAVEDSGVGIPPEVLPRIFERFYRVDRGRSRETGGTGLGLAIVKHTAEGHGGHVEVESEPGKGSTFTLVLPAAHHTAAGTA